MATVQINSSDIFHLDSFPNPQLLGPQKAKINGRDIITHSNTEVGEVKFRSLFFPSIHIMNLHWNPSRNVSILEENPTDTVNINFQMSGQMNTRFAGITNELVMRPGNNNLVFSPEGGFRNFVEAGQQVEMFHISIGKKYFSDLIGCEDLWSERVQEHLTKNRAFAGKQVNLDITPYMHKLIEDLKRCQHSGAMRNLYVQSKVLELLLLQLEQIQACPSARPGLNKPEIGRLHELKHYLEVHFLEDLNLSDLSRFCLLNEFKLKKGFRELFGTTVFEYLRKLRMEYAKDMLRDSFQSIEDISDLLGYEHSQHFSTAFKRYYGLSPSKVRPREKLSNVAQSY